MEPDELTERLWQIAERFYPRPDPRSLLFYGSPPFDIEGPVLHANKKDFEAEVAELNALKNACATMIDVVGKISGRAGETAKNRMEAIVEALDHEAQQSVGSGPFEDQYELIRRVASQQSQSVSAAMLAFDLERAIDKRLQSLEAQREEYWSQPHRPPNHFARIIALRFAQTIARKTGTRPTFGLARDGNHPSTDFGRALEEIFQLLGIGGDVRRPAEWALTQLSDEDFQEPRNALLGMGGTFGLSSGPNPTVNALAMLLSDPARSTRIEQKDPPKGQGE